MQKFLTASLFGLICFLSGVFTQYVLPVGSLNKLMECEEITVSSPTPKPEIQPNEVIVLSSKEQEIKSYAEKITVKVLSGQNSGSGILIHRQGNSYQVVTNDHVLLFGRQDNSYKIITPDGKIYPAKVVNQFNFEKYDLGLLQFESDSVYEVVSLSRLPSPAIGETVYAAGFPYEVDNSVKNSLTFTTGKVNLISDLSFRGGYKIGYTNDVKKGMSGGPLLNQQGQLIGINGRHKYPAWGNPYIFEDGTVASPEKKEEMSQYSWAIPIETFLRLAGNFIIKNQPDLSQIN
ncbi:serine protease [Crocosphaera sp. XPORK-15E]|uniref:S1 family peptidase n=1 Tax=Crocosphaera sp. XPORK-15E TaxID=3110247 RepID=UPI002B2090EE|nr:serine protease [Crocosphaera sp. XPORK-15E]MEA5533351.1 serine protease [Crocosphaera sp. XPORK-15E]